MNMVFVLVGGVEKSGEVHPTRQEWVHLWVRGHSASTGTKGDGEVVSQRAEVDKKDILVNTVEIASTHKRFSQRSYND